MSPSLPFQRSAVLLGTLTVLASWGCKCSGSRTSTEEAAPRAPSRSVPDGSNTAAGPNPLEVVPLTVSTLSLMEPGPKGCEWLRMDPIAQLQVRVALFEGSCAGARISWNQQGDRALVWFDSETMHLEGATERTPAPADDAPTTEARDRLFHVQLTTGEVKKLPLPETAGSLDEVGLSPTGEVLALVQESLPENLRESGRVFVDGEEIRWATEGLEGLPALAHAYRLGEDGKWARTETKPTTEGWDYAAGVDALDAAKTLGPRSASMLAPHFQGEGVVNPELIERLKPFQPTREGAEGQWIVGGTEAGRFFIWEESGEFATTTGVVVLDSGDALAPAPELGFDDATLVAVRAQGPFLLVAFNGTGAQPRLYNLRTRSRVYASNTARAVTFWPGSGKAGAGDHAD